MKISFVIFLLSFFASIVYSKVKIPHEKVIIHVVKTNTMTEINVNCAKFESAFGSDIKEFIFQDKLTNNKLKIYSNDLILDTVTKDKDLDIRAKIIFVYKSGKIDTLCIDGLGDKVIKNGRIWKLNNGNQLFNFIDSLYYTN